MSSLPMFCPLMGFILSTFLFVSVRGEDSLPFTLVTTEQVKTSLGHSATVIVDARTPDAFNGWKLDGIARGGHIPGAIDFAARWLDVPTDRAAEILSRKLAEKGITPDKHVIIYDVTGQDRTKLATYLRNNGFARVSLYDFSQWDQDVHLPLDRYPNFHWLVPPEIVQLLLQGQVVDTFDDVSKIKFAEVSWGDENASYVKGHIPRSFHINTDSIEPPPKWMLADREQLNRFAADHGLTRDGTIILGGEDPTASFRLAVVLRYMGVRDVRVLHGGHSAWRLAGFSLETQRHAPSRAPNFGTNIPANAELIDTISEVREGMNDPKRFTLVDNRTWAEHIGQASGYWYHDKKGRIPGSVYGFSGEPGSGSMSHYRNIDGTMRNAEEIRRLWNKAGIDSKKHLSFMCGSGWRAAEVLTYAQVMGLSDVSLYSDGWIGWSNDPANPVASGVPESGMP